MTSSQRPKTFARYAIAAPAFFWLHVATADPSASSADAVLAEAKAATGGEAWDALRTLSESGRFEGSGISGSYKSVTDLHRVLNAQHSDAGALSSSQGWDGKAAWSADASGQVRIERSRQATAASIAQAYRASYAFFWPARYPAIRVYLGVKTVDNAKFDVVLITPRDCDPFEVWLDHDTHMLSREVDIGGVQPHTVIFSDFRNFHGVLLPWSSRDTFGDTKYDMVTTTASVAAEKMSASTFAPPAPTVERDPFPLGKDRITLPIHLDNNHVYVEARINGGEPHAYLFDTGATAMLDLRAADSMGIKSEGNMATAGFGEATATIGFSKVKSIDLNGFRLADSVMLTMDMSELDKSSGFSADGLLGYEVANQSVVTIDYANRTLVLSRQSAFRPPARSIAVPFKFDAHIPVINASVDGVEGEFQVDTGSSAGLMLMGPFSRAHQFPERLNAKTKVVAGQGVGGLSEGILGRAGDLTIGSLVIKRPIIILQTDERGAGAQSMIAGNIGGELLRRFTVSFDYQHQKIYLSPNAEFSSDDLFDASGMRLNRAPDGSSVLVYVTAGGAAALAGLKLGDRIVSIDGKMSKDISLSDLRDMFRRPDGTTFHLYVVRESEHAREVTLVLKKLA